MRSFKNFRIVDRAMTEKVFEELKFSLSGALSSDVRLQLGKMTGANELLIFQLTRYSNPQGTGQNGLSDRVTLRLISVETGELLASQLNEIDW